MLEKVIDPRSTTLICRDCIGGNHTTHLIGAHIIIVALLSTMIFMTYIVFQRRNQFPIRERSPKLAIWQAFTFIMIVFIPYITEIMMQMGFDWESGSTSSVKFSRKFLKALYMTFRLICYFVFVFRVLVIYSNWKLRNQRSGLFNIFKSESKLILVRIPLVITISDIFLDHYFAGDHPGDIFLPQL